MMGGWTIKRHVVFDYAYNSGISWLIFLNFVQVETGMNTLQMSQQKINHLILIVSLHCLVKLKYNMGLKTAHFQANHHSGKTRTRGDFLRKFRIAYLVHLIEPVVRSTKLSQKVAPCLSFPIPQKYDQKSIFKT